MKYMTLNNGHEIPVLGFGTYKVQQDIAQDLVTMALDAGYRRIDTAALYDNEAEIGAAIRKSKLEREEIYITTKIWNDRHGFDNALEAIDESLERLNIGYVDMLLIHWPAPKRDKYVETWKALEHALESGKVHGIGISNFEPEHINRLMHDAVITPALNQVELHPGLTQKAVRAANAAAGIATEAWSPLARGRFNDNAVLTEIAAKYDKTVSQVIIRWHIDLGNLVIPKTSNPDRLVENFDVFDFELSGEDMKKIELLDTGMRTGAHPDELN